MTDDPEPSEDTGQKPVIQFGCGQKEAAAGGGGEGAVPCRRRGLPMRSVILVSVLLVLLALGRGFWVG